LGRRCGVNAASHGNNEKFELLLVVTVTDSEGSKRLTPNTGWLTPLQKVTSWPFNAWLADAH
jgi:hypothetical protein